MNRIKELRHEQGWSQFKLAEKMDCSVTSIAMYEIERRTPSLSVLLQLCELFNCSIDYILCRTNIRNNIKQDEYNTYFKCIYEEVAHKLDRTKDQTRTYTLKISYPEGEEYKKSEYQNIIDCIEVKIDARQIYR